MPSPVAVSRRNTSMGERSSDKGWPSAALGRERLLNHGVGAPSHNGLDSQLWHACAGAMVHLPQAGAKVFYFPQGHAEHAASPPEFPTSMALRGAVLCRVLSVQFLADVETDEVYARICLLPDPTAEATDDGPPSSPAPEKSSSFAKTLTQSDANNGGGFSVPRFCAETIFPKLDYSQDPPVQIVQAQDVHGAVWKFRHIYRGTPRRHLLTTGWSSFVNQKKLVAGDAIVFLRTASGELCVGVRRSRRGDGAVSGMGAVGPSAWQLSGPSTLPQALRWEPKSSESLFDFLGASKEASVHISRTNSDIAVGIVNFARKRARVTASAVLKAFTSAASGEPFEVIYYPRATISEFCVRASAVRASLRQNWAPGMRLKMAVETEDASRISWFMGTITEVEEPDSVQWLNSPWKMLQVTWDEPDLMQGVTRVSPWQVELVSPIQLSPFSFPRKKGRLLQAPEFHHDGQDNIGFPMAPFTSNLPGHINPWHGFADNVSVGMQGARQDQRFGLATSDLQWSKNKPCLLWQHSEDHEDYVTAEIGQVSTDLSMSNCVIKGGLSTLSNLLAVGGPSTMPTSEADKATWNKDGKAKAAPFLLFGKAIDTSQSIWNSPSQLSSRASFDCQVHEISTGIQIQALCKGHLASCQTNHGSPNEAAKPMANEIKNSATSADTENVVSTPDDVMNDCKIFGDTNTSQIVDL